MDRVLAHSRCSGKVSLLSESLVFNEHLGGGIVLADSAELLRPTRGHTCQGPIFNVLDGISCHD